MRRNATWLLAAAAVTALLGAACGSSGYGGGSDAGGGAAGGKDLSITSPSDGAKVQVPFTLQLSPGVPLGAPDTGNDHVHVYYDGDDSNYEVVTSDTFQVTDLSAGDHTITASLRNADHSAAGSDVTIHVTVTGGGGSGSNGGGGRYGNSGGTSGNDSGGSGGNYGY